MYVVGDQYEAFTTGRTDAVTVHQFWPSPPDPKTTRLQQGLGIADWELDTIRAYLLDGGSPCAHHFTRERADRAKTHRDDGFNILISPPRENGAGPGSEFLFDLVLDETEDRLADHVTGRHVSGMVLLEAGRQAAAYALETVHADKSASFAATWAGAEVGFSSFAFPLPTKINALVITYPHGPNKIETAVDVTVSQLGREVARFVYEIPLLRRTVLARLEAGCARKAVP